jgi:uncharacterized delta-60 repeat protein
MTDRFFAKWSFFEADGRWPLYLVLLFGLLPLCVGQGLLDDFNPNVNGPIRALTVQSDGKVLIGGLFTTVGGVARTNLARLHANGSLDSNFTAGANFAVDALAVQGDGRILVGGAFSQLGGQPRESLGRLNADGSVDGTFNLGADDIVRALLVQPDGKILVGGDFTTLAGQSWPHLLRLNANGSIDTNFVAYTADAVHAIVLQPDGKILTGGHEGYRRLNDDGTMDGGFFLADDSPFMTDVFAVALEPGGSILLGGDFTMAGSAVRTNLARLDFDGVPDWFYEPAMNWQPGMPNPVLALAVQSNGKLLVGGQFNLLSGVPRANFGRLLTNGSIDVAFTPQANGAVRCITVQPDGKVLLGGDFTTVGGQPRNRIARFFPGDDLQFRSASASGQMSLVGTYTNGICTLLTAGEVTGPWRPAKNVYTTNVGASFKITPGISNSFHKALAVELSPGRRGFTNLIESYDLLTTIAGAGGATDDSNKWLSQFENGPATGALLSGPHIALADRAGNVFIADKNAHAIRKVRPDGILVTVVGINVPGNGPDFSTNPATVALNNPNGLWVRGDDTVDILDTDNGKVRVLQTNGILRTLFTVPGGIIIGRGLWVSENETQAYVSSFNTVKKWTFTNGVSDFAGGFSELGNLVVDPGGNLVVTDRNTHSVWRVFSSTNRVRIAGNGTQVNGLGGGDGGLATATGLDGVRGVWFLQSGAFFVCTHRGSQVWYVDTGGFIHLFLNGSRNEVHAGDGTWFWNPFELRVSECRAVTLDRDGNMLLTEHDAGYIRKVKFLRHVFE